jgi:hypothetical protein
MAVFEIDGPLHYEHDVHPCFVVRAPDRVVASVYFMDDDEEAGCAEAKLFVDALTARSEGAQRALSASEVACYRWPDDTPEHKALRQAFCEGAALGNS